MIGLSHVCLCSLNGRLQAPTDGPTTLQFEKRTNRQSRYDAEAWGRGSTAGRLADSPKSARRIAFDVRVMRLLANV